MQRRPTTQDISWFLDQHRNKQLNLSPAYQRRSVWTMKDRRFFLDTVFRGYPCPAIFLHKRVGEDGRAIYDVVDGKQRLETILQFADGKFSLGPHLDSQLSGKKWKDLGEESRKAFWNYVLPVEQLDFAANETEAVNDAFDRLNRNSKRLEPQELRHARFDGWFISLAETEAAEQAWLDLGVVTKARAKRMKDSQLICELLLVIIENGQAGFDQDHLDAACAKYDDPDDEGADLDTDAVLARLGENKAFLAEMNAVNGIARAAGAHVGAFYSLWALVTLHREKLGNPRDFAAWYASFTERAAVLRRAEYKASDGSRFDAAVEKYDRALQGAHTDATPRDTRLEALLEALKSR